MLDCACQKVTSSYQFCVSPHCALELANLSEENGKQKLLGCSQAI